MLKGFRKLGVTFLSVIMLFLSIFAPVGAGVGFGKIIQCHAIDPITVSYELLMNLFLGIGATASGNSFTEEYEEWKNDVANDSARNIKWAEIFELSAAIAFTGTNSDASTAALTNYINSYCTLNEDGTYTISDEVVEDGKLIVPASVTKACANMFDSLTANCTVESIKGRKLSFADSYSYISTVDASVDLLDDRFGTAIIDAITAQGLDYKKCAYLYPSDCSKCFIFPSDTVLCFDSFWPGNNTYGYYSLEAFKSIYTLFSVSNGHVKSEYDNIANLQTHGYLYDVASDSLTTVSTTLGTGLLDVSSSKPYGEIGSGINFMNFVDSGCCICVYTLLLDTSFSYVQNNYLCQHVCVASASTFSKVADSVEEDIAIDLTDENIAAISDATSLDDVINAVDASSAELTSIRDGISDTNEKLEDTNAELTGISGVLSSIYALLAGDGTGTLWDFVNIIASSVVSILSLLRTIVDNVKFLADISMMVANISTFIISLPQNIADAIVDVFPLNAQDIADAIADVFPVVTAFDIASAIADEFPFSASDIATAISHTFPALISSLCESLADTFPYVDIREVVNGISIPGAKDIADAIAQILPKSLTIDGLVEAIVEAIALALTTVLLPDVDALKKHFDLLFEDFSNVFEPIYLPIKAFQRVHESIKVRPEHFVLNFPEIEYDGHVIFTGYAINVTLEFGKYQTLYDLYILFTNVIFTLGLFNYFGKEFEKLMPL